MDGFVCFDVREAGAQVARRCKSSPNLVLPPDRPARLHLTARDVIHSFFVPEFRQKQDAVPGLTTEITVTPTKLGKLPVHLHGAVRPGSCAMRTRAIVMPESEFTSWRAAR